MSSASSASSAASSSLPLSPLVHRLMGLNPGKFTLDGSCTYLVGSGTHLLLVDTGEGKDGYADLLRAFLAAREGARVTDVLITHHHYDHIGGIQQVMDVHESLGLPLPLVHKLASETTPTTPTTPPFRPLKDGQVFTVEGASLRVVTTPGHTDDHVAFWFEQEQAVFSGDCILGKGTAVFRDLHVYMASLKRLLGLQPKRIYPGHGPPVEDGSAKIEQYIAHRERREEQIFEALGLFQEPATAMQIVKVVYAEVDESLHQAACGNVLLHLHKLCKEGRVQQAAQSSKEKPLWSAL